MLFFKRNNEKLKKKNEEFERQLARANKLIDNLDFNIAEYKRKFMNLQMRGRRAQSVSELEQMLRSMQMQAVEAQNAVHMLERNHEDCVQLVNKLVEEFDEALKNVPD